jgi:putative ABC transport system substrate-binding protein
VLCYRFGRKHGTHWPVNRRAFIILIGAAAAARPLATRAQQRRRIWRVGFLAIPLRPAAIESSRYGAFAQGMRELGYVEGDNLAIEYRFAEGKAERLSNLVAELLELKPDVLVVAGTQAVRAAQEATTSIPIVMATTNDPIGSPRSRAARRQYYGPLEPEY